MLCIRLIFGHGYHWQIVLSSFLLVKLVDFSGGVTFGHIVLSCYDDSPLIVHLYGSLRGYEKAK